MWFKNLSLLRFTEPFSRTAEELETILQAGRFRPCSSLEPMSLGWYPPVGPEDGPLVHVTDGFCMVCALKEEKILPASVINDVLAERISDLEDQRGSPVRKKEREALRDDVVHELLPRAFSHTRRTYAYLDPQGGWLVVDSASAKKTEELASLLRRDLESLPVRLPATQERPAAVMTRWLAENQCPADVLIESECELRSPDEEGAIVRCRKQDLAAPEIQNHLEAGKEVVKLAVSWNDRLSCVLDDSLGIRKLRFLDMVQDQVADVETGDEVERFDVDFAIMSKELAAFFPRWLELFGGENSQTNQRIA